MTSFVAEKCKRSNFTSVEATKESENGVRFRETLFYLINKRLEEKTL